VTVCDRLLKKASSWEPAPTDLLPVPRLQSERVMRIPPALCNLPRVSAVANQVLALSASPDVDANQMAAVMEADAASLPGC